MAYRVVGVRFKTAGKKYYFDPGEIELSMGDDVVVETVRGLEIGEIMEEVKTIDDNDLANSLKPVLRKATDKDYQKQRKNQEDIEHVLSACQYFVNKHELDMKLLTAEYMLDRSKLVIYFTAEGRVDFRELVKDLANEFHVRIELRQVGARDGAKFLGGIGPCGYLLCCNTFLGEFETVSIRMAKNQNLSLNPSNISGLCGKLLCCIRYENDTYIEHRKTLPKLYSKVETPRGEGKVVSVNILNQSVKVRFEEDAFDEFDVNELLKIHEYDPLDHVNGNDQ
ncbi:MAG: stage 0 sporulation family protein [Candidatus Izemoplasmataceae bacterium]